MLQELKLNFSIVRDDSRLKGNLHEGIHGWLFHRLKDESAYFADQIHSMRVKPFSIDAFSHKGRVLSSGQTISVAICVIDPRYSQVIFDSLANSLGREYEIGRVRMRFADLQTVRKQTYEELIEKAFSLEYDHVVTDKLESTDFAK